METTRLQKENASVSRNKSGERGYGAAAHDSVVSPFPSGIRVQAQLEGSLRSSLGGGQGLPGPVRSQMESAFGQSFSQVNIHTDSAAAEMSRSIGAKAFTYGNDIFFNQGQFSPDSSSGQHLIAHELAHTVQQSRKVARKGDSDNLPKAEKMVPESANHIGMTTATQEEALRSDIISKNVISNLASEKIEVFANDEENRKKHNNKGGLEIIDDIVSDCMILVGAASKLDKGPKASLVQQLYNTLAQISVAMDILPKFSKDMYRGEDVFIFEEIEKHGKKKQVLKGTTLTEESWIKSRTKFNEVVKKLAALARNPAISVLMFEGTYYPGEFTSFTYEAANKLVKDSDSSLLAYAGAVCNNAAYASAASAGVQYQSSKDGNQTVHPVKPFTGLGRESRQHWRSYGLKGDGQGDNAFDEAKQGDIVVFWNYDKCEGEIKKQLNAFDDSYPDDEKVVVLEEAKSKGLSEYKKLKFLESSLAKEAYDKAQAAYESAEKNTKIKAKEKDKAKTARDKAKTKYEKVEKQANPVLTTFDLGDPIPISYDEYNKTIGILAKRIFPRNTDSAADLVVPANLNASHIEVIVGVDAASKKYLTSGAHGSNYVNGFSRAANGRLDWKSPSNMRDNRIMRVVPLFVDEKAPLISVNIPEIMTEQHYEIPKRLHDAAVIEAYNAVIKAQNKDIETQNAEIEEFNKLNPKKKKKKLPLKREISKMDAFEKIYPDEKTRKAELTALREQTNTPPSDSESDSESDNVHPLYSPGEYTSQYKVFVYQNKNLSQSVTIDWLKQNDAPADAVPATDTAAQEQ